MLELVPSSTSPTYKTDTLNFKPDLAPIQNSTQNGIGEHPHLFTKPENVKSPPL